MKIEYVEYVEPDPEEEKRKAKELRSKIIKELEETFGINSSDYSTLEKAIGIGFLSKLLFYDNTDFLITASSFIEDILEYADVSNRYTDERFSLDLICGLYNTYISMTSYLYRYQQSIKIAEDIQITQKGE